MKIFIITSYFNPEVTIGDAIESVLSQTYPDIEYIVIDRASKNGSQAVVQRYKEGIAQIISERDRGMHEVINKGLKRATGDIIGLIHSDDFLFSKETIAHIVRKFEETDADLMYSNRLFVNAKDIETYGIPQLRKFVTEILNRPI